MRWLHLFVEERSAEAALIDIVPAVLTGIDVAWDFEIRIFEGKFDLLRKLPQRLKAYRNS